jgi:histone-lysine N-methyltransferase SETMAR
MENLHQVIARHCAARRTPNECAKELGALYGDKAPSLSTIHRVYAKVRGVENGDLAAAANQDQRVFNRGARSARTDDVVAQVAHFLAQNPASTIEEVALAHDLAPTTTFRIVSEDLKMTKKCAKWVPHELSAAQRQKRVDCAKAIVRQTRGVTAHIVTGDESWVHLETPETKDQSKVGTPGPRKARKAHPKKVMLTLFFDASGAVCTEFLRQGTISTPTYITTLRHLREDVRRKRPYWRKRGEAPPDDWFLHQDNAPAHRSGECAEYMRKAGFNVLAHPPYSPDLAPCDFWAFGALKHHLAGAKYATAAELEEAVRHWLAHVGADAWRSVFDSWRRRLNRCIELDGDYVE